MCALVNILRFLVTSNLVMVCFRQEWYSKGAPHVFHGIIFEGFFSFQFRHHVRSPIFWHIAPETCAKSRFPIVDLASKYCRNSNNWPLHCDRTLELPLLVRSEFFSFLSVSGGRFLVCFFRPFSKGGNFGLHSTWANYSGFYGTVPYAPCPCFGGKEKPAVTVRGGIRPHGALCTVRAMQVTIAGVPQKLDRSTKAHRPRITLIRGKTPREGIVLSRQGSQAYRISLTCIRNFVNLLS